MTWFRIDDDWLTHPKVQLAGRDGRDLWVATGVQCARAGTDGHVDGRLIVPYARLAEVRNPNRAAEMLVMSGLWHNAETLEACGRCVDASGGVDAGNCFFHDWFDYQLRKDGKTNSVERDRELRRKRLLRKPDLCSAIRRRDRDLCRYCGRLTAWTGDRRSALSGTYDHVNPFGGNSMANVVVACRRCNGTKRDRTPEQANMVLLPEPDPYLPPGQNGASSDLAPGQNGASSDLDPIQLRSGSASRDARDGTGQVGAGSGPDPGSGLDGPEHAGDGVELELAGRGAGGGAG